MDSQTPQAQNLNPDSSSPSSASVSSRRFSSLSFLSGFCAVVCTGIGFQLLRPILGASAGADATATSLLFLGLSLGAVWWGHRAMEADRPLELLARWHIGLALSAAVTPWIGDASGSFYPFTSGPLGVSISRIVLAGSMLALPGFWVGGLLPTITQAASRASDPDRRQIGALSAWAFLGAAVGLPAIHFFFIELFGLRRTLWLACMLLLLLAMGLRNLARLSEGSTAVSAPQKPGDFQARGLLLVAGAVGFAILLMVQVWRRMLTPLLGDSIFATTLVPAFALLGIGLGSLIYHQGASDQRPTLRSLALAFGWLALTLIIPFALGDWIALGAAFLRPLMVTGFPGLVVSWALVTSAVLLPAALVVGFISALWPALRGQGARDVGAQLGRLLGSQFLGAALAAGIYGLGRLPSADIPQLWQLLTINWLCLSVMVSMYEFWRRKRDLQAMSSPSVHAFQAYKLPLGTLMILVVVCWLLPSPGPSAFWRHTDIGNGRIGASFKNPHELQSLMHAVGRGVLAEADGTKSSVALVRDNDLALVVDGRNRGTAHGDAPSQVMGPLIGAALHREPRSILVLGLTTGRTAGWLAQVPSVERIDVLEIEPKVVQLLREIGPSHHDLLNSPKAHLRIGDGREWLAVHREPYDLIISGMSNPYRDTDSHLFSREFYRTVIERLKPGGLFLQGLDGIGIAPETLQGCFATLRSVFPSIETWQPDTRSLLLVASAEPVLHRLDLIERRLAQEPWRKAMREIWGADGLTALYSAFLANNQLAETLSTTSTVDVSTDDRPSLKHSFSRQFGYPEALDIARLRALTDYLVAGQPQISPGTVSTVDWSRALELRATRSIGGIVAQAGPWARTASSSDRDSGIQLHGEALARFSARKAWQAGDLPSVHRLWPKTDNQPSAPLFFSDQLMLGELLAAGLYDQSTSDGGIPSNSDPGAESGPGAAGAPETDHTIGSQADPADPFAHLRQDAPVESLILEARLAYAESRIGEAAAHLEAAFGILRKDSWVHLPMVDRGFQLAKKLASFDSISGQALLRALDHPFAAYTFEEVRLATRINLAARIHLDGGCREIYADYEPHPIWTLRFLQARLHCYQLSEPDPEMEVLLRHAERDTLDFLQHNPPKLQLLGRRSAADVGDPEPDGEIPEIPDLATEGEDREP